MPWIYEPDPRNKHKRNWDADEAGFVLELGGAFVGKCPASISIETAEQLLNDEDAIPVYPVRWRMEYPKMILNVHEGVLYRATWTIPGRSCHGFPEHPERAEGLPKSVGCNRLSALSCEGYAEERW